MPTGYSVEPPWPEGSMCPNGEAFADWFVQLTRDEQIMVGNLVVDHQLRSWNCAVSQHDSLADELSHVHGRLADMTMQRDNILLVLDKHGITLDHDE